MTNAPNDVLYLRFYGEDENPPPLRPITLSSCTGALENVIKSPFPANQGPLRKSVLNIVASPRHGCLEIVLQLDLGIAINSASWKLFGESSDDARALLNDVRDWAEFLLLLVFGGRGLLDLYVHGQQSPKGKLAEGGVATLAISMAPMLIKQAGVLKAIRDLSEIGSKAGFRRRFS